jgi:site-specific DNA-cytosine methylase
MKYLTVCSGIEAVSLAWEPLDFVPVAFSEISDFPKAVLAHHWPHVPNLGDMTSIDGSQWEGKVDILWGSTPCQAFSISGKRNGVADPRGALTLSFVNLADSINPPYLVWENVKGVLSDKDNAFGCFLGGLAGEDVPLVPAGGKWAHAGYVSGPKRTIAWRLFDAKYSGVPQRRERIFVVACPTGGADPREILFEKRTGNENPKGSRLSRKALADALETSSPKRAFTVAFRGRSRGEECEVGDQVANCLRASTGGSDKAYALIDDEYPHIRYLTPLECERLMGIPDNFTLIPYGRKMASDTVRYKAIGNSLVVPDVRWIGERIRLHELTK